MRATMRRRSRSLRAGKSLSSEETTKKLADVRKQYDEETKAIDQKLADWEKSVDAKSLPKDLADIVKLPAAQRNAAQNRNLPPITAI